MFDRTIPVRQVEEEVVVVMETKRQSQLTDQHLRKLAFVYPRVSTKDQAENSRASLAGQQDQTRFALEDGFPLDRIQFVDSDVGVSGKFMANRIGIGEVRDGVRWDRAGAIYVSAIDRLGRNDYESLGLLKDCIKHRVVIVENGTHYNPKDLRQLIPLRFKSFLAEMENIMRQIRINDAIETCIRRKEEFTAPPVGYIRSDDGTSWVKDPDQKVQRAIDAVFRIFGEEHTVPKTVRRLRAEGIQLPRRERRKGKNETEERA